MHLIQSVSWPESSVGAQRQRGEIWVIVQVDRGDAGGQDVYHPDCHYAPVQPVLLVEGAVAHLRPICGEFSLGKGKEEKTKQQPKKNC